MEDDVKDVRQAPLTPSEQLRLKACEDRDRHFALLLTEMVALAAHTHPEILREALGSVYDTKRANRELDRMTARQQRLRELIEEERVLLAAIRKDIEDIGKRFDALEDRLQRHDRRTC